MNGMDALLAALAGFIILLTGLGGYLFNRLKNLEKRDDLRREQDQKSSEAEKALLRTRVADLEVKADKVPPMEREITQLREQVNTLLSGQKALQDQVTELRAAYEAEKDENAKLRKEKDETNRINAELFEANKSLKLQLNTYERALTLLGIQIAERESTEKKPETADPQAGEAPKPEETTEETHGTT